MVCTGRAGTGQTGAGELSPLGKSLSRRWLAAALEATRRFSRDVAQDIGWLLNQGRLLGVRAAGRQPGYVWRPAAAS